MAEKCGLICEEGFEFGAILKTNRKPECVIFGMHNEVDCFLDDF